MGSLGLSGLPLASAGLLLASPRPPLAPPWRLKGGQADATRAQREPQGGHRVPKAISKGGHGSQREATAANGRPREAKGRPQRRPGEARGLFQESRGCTKNHLTNLVHSRGSLGVPWRVFASTVGLLQGSFRHSSKVPTLSSMAVPWEHPQTVEVPARKAPPKTAATQTHRPQKGSWQTKRKTHLQAKDLDGFPRQG